MLKHLLAPRAALLTSILLVATAAALPQPSWAWQVTPVWSDGGGPLVQGSGTVTESARNPGAFSKLNVQGPLTVNVRGAGQNAVRVKADDNLQPLIETQLSGDTLQIRIQPNNRVQTRNPIVIEVDTTQLDEVALAGSGTVNVEAVRGSRFKAAVAGSGDVTLKAVDVGQLSLAVAGSGDMRAKGRAQELSASVAGSGDLHLYELVAQNATVNVAGSGDANVHVSGALKANIAGSGDIRYKGQPTVSRSVMGSGDITAVR